jgi:hypothetical protein
MSLQLQNYFNGKGFLANFATYQLSNTDLRDAKVALLYDNHSFFLNGLITFSSTINSLNKQNYSWAFIQSYYSLYYLIKSFLSINDYGIVFINKKPFCIKLSLSEKFKKLNGNSHEVVINLYNKEFSSDILVVNNIGGNNPLVWFKTQRELINYKFNPFSDPEPPLEMFKYNNDIRKWINIYFADYDYRYTFSKEHSYLAYPIQLIIKLFDYYDVNELKNPFIDDEKIDYFKKNISDNNGPITSIISKIETLKQ